MNKRPHQQYWVSTNLTSTSYGKNFRSDRDSFNIYFVCEIKTLMLVHKSMMNDHLMHYVHDNYRCHQYWNVLASHSSFCFLIIPSSNHIESLSTDYLCCCYCANPLFVGISYLYVYACVIMLEFNEWNDADGREIVRAPATLFLSCDQILHLMNDIETNNSLCFLPKRGYNNINNNFQPLTLYSVLVGYFKYSLFWGDMKCICIKIWTQGLQNLYYIGVSSLVWLSGTFWNKF